MSHQIGSLMGFAERQAALAKFGMDKTYKARLARAFKEELERGAHYEDVKAAARIVISRRLSPYLLHAKVREINVSLADPEPGSDPYEDFPDYSTVKEET